MQNRYRGKVLQHKKAVYNKTTANIILSVENLKTFSLRSGTRKECPLSRLFNLLLEGLATAMREEKEK